MDFESVFRKENIDLIFNDLDSEYSYIAETGDLFSVFMDRNDFGYRWAWKFPAGRYVITIFQRHSLFRNGEKIYQNESFEDQIGKNSRYRKTTYAVLLDEEMKYSVSSWDHKLISHFLHDEAEPLQIRVFDLEEAEKEALEYSKNGHNTAIMAWFEDYDMY